ncbi:glycosyltransferase family 4 protein [Paenibacillus sedimenti]|uniref:Glycosyltransferase family 4 protein n=1 Tax=Paenibacillus sedimenti TaxID=2770274 RepID=A0A926KR46_9BACL|nr:glycosyltransferase family 4 protein [Paenibacillus sedimenti]MBD0381601.1 glycosyltransferase family 4 protein [Paenibacillus sedimenti]
MKFTFPIITLSIGGAQRMLAELVNGLTDRGHEVTILMPRAGIVEFPIKAEIIRTRQLDYVEVDEFPPSDVIVSNYFTLVSGSQVASERGKGVHIRLSLCYEPAFLPDNHLTFRTYHHTRNLLVLSKWQQQLIHLLHGVMGHIVPVGLSPAFHNQHLRESRNQLQISAILRKPEWGHVWHREQDYLLHHLQLIKAQYPHVQINIFTPPTEFATSPYIQSLSKQYPFRFIQPADDQAMCKHYNESDIFVSSSTYDTAQIPGLEAMRCGASLVTTYAGGNMDYCRNEENCLLSYRYENNLSDQIRRLIEDPSLRKKLAQAGEKESMKWTWDRSLNEFEKAVYAITGKRL